MKRSRPAMQNEEAATRRVARRPEPRDGNSHDVNSRNVAGDTQADSWSAQNLYTPPKMQSAAATAYAAGYGAAREAEFQVESQAQAEAQRQAEAQARAADLEAEHVLRAANRVRRRRRNRARAAGIAKALLVGTVSLGLWAAIAIGWADFRWTQNELGGKRVQLAGLQVQLKAGQDRLNALQVDKGRVQSLVEHGYVRPGDRILLFPSEPSAKDAPPVSGATPFFGATPSAHDSIAPRAPEQSSAAPKTRPKASTQATGDAASQPEESDVTSDVASNGSDVASNGSDVASNGAASSVKEQAAAPSPSSRQARPSATSSQNEPSDPPDFESSRGTPSMWRRAGQTLNNWWNAARGR